MGKNTRTTVIRDTDVGVRLILKNGSFVVGVLTLASTDDAERIAHIWEQSNPAVRPVVPIRQDLSMIPLFDMDAEHG